MAISTLFTLLDDMAVLLDDIAVMTKVAAQKTVAVVSDDLAVNAKQVEGIASKRELPVVWAVAKGSLKNKAILVPAAMLLAVFASWLIMPLLMIGGAYLCFEGAEKVWDHYHTSPEEKAAHADELRAMMDDKTDMVTYEKDKIQGAIRTDFILSAEIIVIALSVVADKSYAFQALLLVLIALGMTIFVYGLVAFIIRLDDMGFALQRSPVTAIKAFGSVLVASAPKLMKLLSVVGTIAMFMVGGEFVLHGIPWIHHGIEHFTETLPLGGLIKTTTIAVAGLVIGLVLVGVEHMASHFRKAPHGTT